MPTCTIACYTDSISDLVPQHSTVRLPPWHLSLPFIKIRGPDAAGVDGTIGESTAEDGTAEDGKAEDGRAEVSKMGGRYGKIT